MGDRANIKIKQPEGQALYLYSHWGGSNLPQVLQDALTRGKERWNDETYLARIIFSQMVKDDILELTGYGLSTYETDGFVICEVDTDAQMVKYADKNYTFTEYCALEIVA